MDPNQTPTNPDRQPEMPAPPLADIPDEAFGFADESPTAHIPQPIQVQPVAPLPAATPVAPTPPAALPPAPQPLPPTVASVPAAAPRPSPVDIMPPQSVPAVPAAATPPPLPPAQPTPLPPPAPTVPPARAATFDPRVVPVHASSTSENPITATYTPTPTTHTPEDIAKRIGEHPMQNSEDVLRLAKHGFDIKRVKSVVSFLVFAASIFLAAFLINQFIFQSYYVEGLSMSPTLQNNDRLIISKVERSMSVLQGKQYIPERGQIVVLDSSITGINGQKEQLIKRVIGLPGDHIHIEKGVITITNSEHPQGYDVTQALGLTNLQPTHSDEPIDLVIPANHVYVIGDNREQGSSYDSRSFGPIEGNKIQGRLWARILPLDKAQLF